MRPLTNGGNDWESVSMHRVVTLNTLCSIASIYFILPHNTTGSFQSHPLSSRKTMYFRTDELLVFSQGIA